MSEAIHLDTNVVVEWVRRRDEGIVARIIAIDRSRLALSFAAHGELLVGLQKAPEGPAAERLRGILDDLRLVRAIARSSRGMR